MLIIISSPTALANEADVINALFDEGLEILHLRKPELPISTISSLLDKIKPEYHCRIALHQHHELAEDIGTNKLHFTSAKRSEISEEELADLKAGNKILSTSVHSIDEYQMLSGYFDYTFFGPVFNSISKQGYKAVITNDFIFPTHHDGAKVIAIGGIEAASVEQAMEMKFDGVAALGTIWQKESESVQQFKNLQRSWKQTGRLY